MGATKLGTFLGALLLLCGCVDNDGPAVFISGNLSPTDACEYAPGNAFVAEGALNVDRAVAYFIHPEYNGQLRSRGSDAPLRADPNGMQIEGAEIELQSAAGDALSLAGLPNPFVVPVSTYIASTPDPSSTSKSAGSIQAVPPPYVTALRDVVGPGCGDVQVVLAKVRVFGTTIGGVDVESGDWSWPITLCRGDCLVACSTDPAVADVESTCCGYGQDGLCIDASACQAVTTCTN